MANPAPTINQINAFNATQGTTIDFNIIGGTELIRSNRIYIYDLSDNSLICTHLYVSTESIHELPPNTDGSIVYESGKSSADFVNGAQYYAQIQTYTDTAGTQGGSGLSVAKMFWCLVDPTLTITAIPSTISTTSYNISATYTDTSASVVSNIIQQYQFNLYSATGSLLQSSGVVVGSGAQQGTSATYDISHNFTGLNVGSSYYVTVNVTTTQGMSVTTQSNTFTVSIDTPTLGEATVVNNACDGYISVTSNLSGEYGGSGSGEIVSFETDSEDIFTKLQVDLEPTQEGSGTPSPSNVRPIRGHSGVDVNVGGKNLFQTTAESKTENGLTWTVNQDGTITVTGTPTDYTILNVGRAYVNGVDDNVTISQIDPTSNVMWGAIGVYDSTNQLLYQVTSGGATPKFTVNLANYPTADYIQVHIKRNSNNVATNTTVKIQVEKGTTATEWEPYQPQTITQDFNATLTPTSTDTTPYLFKAVGDVYGDRLEDKIVGGTVAWNQLVDPSYYESITLEGVTFAKGENNTIVATGENTSTSSNSTLKVVNNISGIANKVFYITGCPDGGESGKYRQWIPVTKIGGTSANRSMYETGGGTLIKFASDDGSFALWEVVYHGYAITGSIVWKPQVFDLTQMFGSTIADYIYSLEQSQAGVGVAWFKKLFPNDYYAYNAGELLSVEGLSAHVMRDADNNVIGNYPLDSSLTLRGIPKLDASNNLYYDGDEYTSDGKVKRKYGVVDLGTLSWTYHTSSATFYCVINTMNRTNGNLLCSKYTKITQGIDYLNNMEFSYQSGVNTTLWFKNTAYTDVATFKTAMSGVMLVYELATPTTETAEAYTNPQIVSKYGTLEYVTNSIVPVGHKTTYLTRDIFGGYVDLISGKLVVTHGYVDLGTLPWAYDGEPNNRFRYNEFAANYNAKMVGTWDTPNLLSDMYIAKATGSIPSSDMCVGVYDAGGWLLVRNSNYTDVASFKSAMNGVQLVYELATPQTYQLTPQQVNTLVGTNNVWSEQGSIELSYHIPITNLLVKRQDVDDVSGGWLTLYSQPISQASDMDFTFIDFLNQYGKTYKYALVPLLTQTQSGVEVEVEGGYTVSDEVQSVFDGVFIADSTGSQKCKANVGYGNVDMNQVVGSITPIGAKYPIIITNSHNQYHNGSISGTIVPDDYYFNGNLSRIDMVKKRNELEQFLTNKRVKVIKDWNGNIWLVMIAGNVSCTFNNNYGMGIVSFSTNWTEVGDPTNQQDLQATGLINVGGV